ncbi:MAG: AzlD domain-containing protein [Spirochaetia bacterium]|nr:AzlD domain-containing protein [Spirochaetia bacterium]
MNFEIVLIVLFSAAGTYFARVIPFFISFLERLPLFFRRFLRVMPVAALGALLFPGLLIDFSHAPAAGLIGTAAAAVTALFSKNLLLPVAVSVAAAYFMI